MKDVFTNFWVLLGIGGGLFFGIISICNAIANMIYYCK